MTLRLLTAPLLAASLLLGTLGCSKKPDPAPAPNTGSYVRDGKTIACTVTIYLHPASRSGGLYDVVEVQLATTPQPASGKEILHFNFSQNTSTSAYFLSSVGFSLSNAVYPTGLYYPRRSATATLTATGNGGFTGTFSGSSTSPASVITNGSFRESYP